VVRIDQSPIGRTPRSNPATYTQVFSPIRDLFAMLPEARERGYKPGRFSFNVGGGRCEACQGDGQRRIEMNFMPDVYVQCEVCNGRRYNQETLAVKFHGHSIADILDLTIEDALTVLADVPQVRQKLQTLVDVGLGYVHLGQSATTLSGGEAQRMKLARELSKRQTGRTLYLLDEPTTGLHFDDVRKLLEVLHRLTDLGNTVIIIEHNLDVIRNADWILDLGPEGGEDGGRIVGEGRPAKIAATPGSYTGQFLKRYYTSLPAIALGCFALAARQWLLPGPEHAPIEDIFRSPGAAWLMFGFGVTFAPFFEEICLPRLSAARPCHGLGLGNRKSTGKPARPLDANGHPQWSIFAMVIASIPPAFPSP
jgi:excinuclease ABC subunit A